MSNSIEDLLLSAPRLQGARDRHGVPVGLFKEKRPSPSTPIDKTSAAAKVIIDAEATERADKTARLKAAREARDQDR